MSEMIERVARALMKVLAPPPASDGQPVPVLSLDPDFDDLPRDHTEGTVDDEITQEAVLRLARAAIAPVHEVILSMLDAVEDSDTEIVVAQLRRMIDEAFR